MTIYGISQPATGTKDKDGKDLPTTTRYISKLSPIYNFVPDSDGNPLQTDGKAIAACGDDRGTNYVCYISSDAYGRTLFPLCPSPSDCPNIS